MKKLLLIPLLLLSLTTMAACSTTDDTPDTPSGNGNMLVLYFLPKDTPSHCRTYRETYRRRYPSH